MMPATGDRADELGYKRKVKSYRNMGSRIVLDNTPLGISAPFVSDPTGIYSLPSLTYE